MSMSIDDVINRLADAERRFAGQEFLAPLVGEGRVQVRIAGVVCRLRVTGLPQGFRGWAVLRAGSASRAEFVRAAGMAETAAYLRLFPAVALIIVTPGRCAEALPARRGDARFHIAGPVPVWLGEDGLERFDSVLARFDGRLFWYERRDPSRDPAIAAYLREQLARREEGGLPPAAGTLHKCGLAREEREAYAYSRERLVQAQQSAVERRLAEALAHAGAELGSYAERADAYVVTYTVDGRQHVSTVRRDDLTVLTAGICLSGQDRRFDLASLVGVLREGAERGRLVWVGEGGLDEEDYREIHPPLEGD